MSLQGVSFGRGRKREPRISAPYVPGVRHERYWKEAELQVLRDHYHDKGILFCLNRLPGRTKQGAYSTANKLGLRRDGAPAVRGSYRAQFPEIDAALMEAWPNLSKGRGALKALATKLQVPRDLLSRRLRFLGLTMPRIKELPWAPAEDELLKRVPRHSPDKAAEIFAAHGFKRTGTAIMVRCKRVGLSRRYSETLSANAASKILGVDGKTFTLWIGKGWIKAGRRGTRRVSQQGGDSHTIERSALRQFILDNLERIDIRKVDKFSFVELLVDPSAGAGATTARTTPIRRNNKASGSSRRKESS